MSNLNYTINSEASANTVWLSWKQCHFLTAALADLPRPTLSPVPERYHLARSKYYFLTQWVSWHSLTAEQSMSSPLQSAVTADTDRPGHSSCEVQSWWGTVAQPCHRSSGTETPLSCAQQNWLHSSSGHHQLKQFCSALHQSKCACYYTNTLINKRICNFHWGPTVLVKNQWMSDADQSSKSVVLLVQWELGKKWRTIVQ